MIEQTIFFEDIEAGLEMAFMERTASITQLFMFSAATNNPHRIHYDRESARIEGHPDLLVHGPLQGAWLGEFVTRWMGPLGRLKKLEYTNRGRAFPGERLIFKGRVAKKEVINGEFLVLCEIWEEKELGEIILPGKAVVSLPSRKNV